MPASVLLLRWSRHSLVGSMAGKAAPSGHPPCRGTGTAQSTCVNEAGGTFPAEFTAESVASPGQERVCAGQAPVPLLSPACPRQVVLLLPLHLPGSRTKALVIYYT